MALTQSNQQIEKEEETENQLFPTRLLEDARHCVSRIEIIYKVEALWKGNPFGRFKIIALRAWVMIN